MIENFKIQTVAYIKLGQEKVLLDKAKMLLCNSQWDIHHTLSPMCISKLETTS